jgi:hypothetical protein
MNAESNLTAYCPCCASEHFFPIDEVASIMDMETPEHGEDDNYYCVRCETAFSQPRMAEPLSWELCDDGSYLRGDMHYAIESNQDGHGWNITDATDSHPWNWHVVGNVDTSLEAMQIVRDNDGCVDEYFRRTYRRSLETPTGFVIGLDYPTHEVSVRLGVDGCQWSQFASVDSQEFRSLVRNPDTEAIAVIDWLDKNNVGDERFQRGLRWVRRGDTSYFHAREAKRQSVIARHEAQRKANGDKIRRLRISPKIGLVIHPTHIEVIQNKVVVSACPRPDSLPADINDGASLVKWLLDNGIGNERFRGILNGLAEAA